MNTKAISWAIERSKSDPDRILLTIESFSVEMPRPTAEMIGRALIARARGKDPDRPANDQTT